MTIRTKLVAVMAVPVVLLVTATFALVVSRDSANAALRAERQAVALQNALERVVFELTGAEAATSGYVLTGDRALLEPYGQSVAALPGDMRRLLDLAEGNSADVHYLEEVANLQVLASRLISRFESLQSMAPVDDRTNHAQLISLMSGGARLEERIRGLISHEETEIADLLAERQRTADANRRLSFLIGVVGLPVALLGGLLLVVVFTQRLVTRIRRTEDMARLLDEGMPLAGSDPPDDELGRLERVLLRSGTRIIELQGELRRMVTADPSTGLLNRRGFLPTAEHYLEVAKRTHQPMALMFLDLDGLKHVNDMLGHAAGDGMITEAAYIMRETFRASDLIARMGGDEFCVLFAAESEDAASTAVTRLQTAVDEANDHEGRPFVLSISTGTAMFDPEQPCTLDKLIAAADERMYECKRAKAGARTDAAPIA